MDEKGELSIFLMLSILVGFIIWYWCWSALSASFRKMRAMYKKESEYVRLLKKRDEIVYHIEWCKERREREGVEKMIEMVENVDKVSSTRVPPWLRRRIRSSIQWRRISIGTGGCKGSMSFLSYPLCHYSCFYIDELALIDSQDSQLSG